MSDDSKSKDGNPKSSKRAKMLSKMYDYTNGIADKNIGSNRGLAASTAATLLDMGIDRMNKSSNTGLSELTEEEISEFKDMALSVEEEEYNNNSGGTSKNSKSSHFIDHLLEKYLRHSIPEEDRDMFNEKLHDPERAKKPGLSLKILASNFKILSTQMSAFFEIQYSLIHLITWRKPTKTLSFLVLYTSICLWPHLILALPLLFLLFGIMIPAYIHRHPMRTPELIKVKKRGQSLLDFFNQSLDDSIVMDLLNEDFDNDPYSLEPTSSRSSEVSTSTAIFTQHPISAATVSTDPADVNEKVKKSNKAKRVKSQMSLMLNMRDLQNLTTDVLSSFDAAEKFWYETAGFKDERLSTFIFYGVILASSIILFLGRFIPWRLIFIQSGWAGIGLCHPNSKKYLLSIKKNRKRKATVRTEGSNKEKVKEAKKFERNDIIIDDAAEVRIVEIFELQTKSLTKNEWTFFRYTNGLFDLKDHVRISGKRPNGVDHLSKVKPPPDWKFDFGYKNNWGIDTNPSEFLQKRLLDNNCLKVDEKSEEGWIYDLLENKETLDSIYEFRRRRLIRDCFRYSRPAKLPQPQ